MVNVVLNGGCGYLVSALFSSSLASSSVASAAPAAASTPAAIGSWTRPAVVVGVRGVMVMS